MQATQQLQPRQASDAEARIAEYVPFGAKESIKLSVAIVKSFICTPTKSGKICDDREAMRFIMLCKARGLNPFEGDAYLIGYDGQDGATFSLITAHQAFLKRAEVNEEYDGMESGVIVQSGNEILDREGDFMFEDEKLLGAWAVVFFKTRTHPMKKRINLKTFVKPYGVWKTNAAGMIVKCAESDALRSSFPTLLGSLYLEEEMQTPSMVIDETPKLPAPGRHKTARKPESNGTTHEPEQPPEPDMSPGEIPTEPETDLFKPSEPTPEDVAKLQEDADAKEFQEQLDRTGTPIADILGKYNVPVLKKLTIGHKRDALKTLRTLRDK